MKNCRALGRRNELRVKKYYESQGFIVQLAPTSRKWQNNQDFFGLFDGVALRSGGLLRWFQCKTNRKPPLDVFADFAKKFVQTVEVVVVKPKGLAVVYVIEPIGTRYVTNVKI